MAELSEVERYEIALRRLIADLDYGLHKSLERDEEDSSDSYPEIAQEFFEYVSDTHASDWCEKHQHYIPMGVSCGGN